MVYWLDNSGLALEKAFQAGTVLQEHCEVGNKAEAVSRVDTDVEEEAALALELSVLVVQAGWWAPVGLVVDMAVAQVRHALDRGSGSVLLDIEVGTSLVVSSIFELAEGMDVALELADLALGSAEVEVAPQLAQGQDMAEM